MGGGVATPMVEGITGLHIEAYDGIDWYSEWDSDIDGLPMAVRVVVTASGHRAHEDPYDAPLVTLRTAMPIDRVLTPRDVLEEEYLLAEELEQALQAAEQAQQGAEGEGGGVGGAGGTVPRFGDTTGGPMPGSDTGGPGRSGGPGGASGFGAGSQPSGPPPSEIPATARPKEETQ
jgi:hypothetical protein